MQISGLSQQAIVCSLTCKYKAWILVFSPSQYTIFNRRLIQFSDFDGMFICKTSAMHFEWGYLAKVYICVTFLQHIHKNAESFITLMLWVQQANVMISK
jgi:hypothetical protein